MLRGVQRKRRVEEGSVVAHKYFSKYLKSEGQRRGERFIEVNSIERTTQQEENQRIEEASRVSIK